MSDNNLRIINKHFTNMFVSITPYSINKITL